MNWAKILGILAALITMRYVVVAMGRRVAGQEGSGG